MLYSEDFLRELEETPVREQFERVISVCVGMKLSLIHICQMKPLNTGG